MRKLFLTALITATSVLLIGNSFMNVSAINEETAKLFRMGVNYYEVACSTAEGSQDASDISPGSGDPKGLQFPNLDPAAMANGINKYIEDTNPSSKMKGLGDTIVASSKHSNINPFFVTSIAHKESQIADPSLYNVRNANNAFGRSATSSQPNIRGAGIASGILWYKWSSVKASVDHTAEENKNISGGGDVASYLKKKYEQQIDKNDLKALMYIYAPPGHLGNDTDQYIKDIRSWMNKMLDLSNSSGSASDTGANPSDSGSTSDSGLKSLDGVLSDTANSYNLHSIAVRGLDDSSYKSYRGDSTPSSVASVVKLAIVEAYLSTDPDLSEEITITSSDIYGGDAPQGNAWDPSVGQRYTLKQSIEATLKHSSNTQANVLIRKAGGLAKITQLANERGYKSTKIPGYFKASGGSNPRKSNTKDLSLAMKKIFSGDVDNYKIAQDALKASTYDFGLSSIANKWGGMSSFTGNVGVFDVGGKKYIISVFAEQKWTDAVLPSFPATRSDPKSKSVDDIKDATNSIIRLMNKGGVLGINNIKLTPPGCACPASEKAIEGINNAVKAYNYFLNDSGLGLTPTQVAGIIGNLMRESAGDTFNLDPSTKGAAMCPNGSDCMGIAQWDEHGRWAALKAWAESVDKDPSHLSTQLEYIKVELEKTPANGLSELKAVGGEDEASAKAAAVVFDEKFERSSHGRDLRQNNAAKFFNEFIKNNSSTPTPLPDSGATADSNGTCGSSEGSKSSGATSGEIDWPDDGRKDIVTSCFGARSSPGNGIGSTNHMGVDIGSPSGSNVTAADGGKVTQAGGDFNNTIVIEHGNGAKTRYLHNSQISVEANAMVDKGEVIGKVGSVGQSTGPHIHFEYYENNVAKNPREQLPKDSRAILGSNCG